MAKISQCRWYAGMEECINVIIRQLLRLRLSLANIKKKRTNLVLYEQYMKFDKIAQRKMTSDRSILSCSSSLIISRMWFSTSWQSGSLICRGRRKLWQQGGWTSWNQLKVYWDEDFDHKEKKTQQKSATPPEQIPGQSLQEPQQSIQINHAHFHVCDPRPTTIGTSASWST